MLPPEEDIQQQEIYKLERIGRAYAMEGTRLYSSGDPWEITHLTVDPRGNVYFSHVYAEKPLELLKIRANTEEAEVLLTLEDFWMLDNVYIASKGREKEKIFFTTISEAVTSIHMFDVRSGELTTVLEKSHEYFGYFAYLNLGGNGDLYYLYRQRSDISVDQWGYLEIGKFTQKSLKNGGNQTVLCSKEFDKGVWVHGWILGGRRYLRVSDIGDIFFSIPLYEDGQLVLYFYWLNPATGTLTELLDSEPLSDLRISFVIDGRQDVYYTNFHGNDMTRINFIARRR